jgi:phosphate acetyltransferase
VTNQNEQVVVLGKANVLAPTEKIRTPKLEAPQIHVFDPDVRFRNLLAMGSGMEAVVCGVVHPCDGESLQGAIEAAARGLIKPVLIAPKEKLYEVANQYQLDITPFDIVDVPHSHAAAEVAAQLAAQKKVEALMKGSLHTDELMHAVISNRDLRTKRRLSHIFRFEVPLYNKPILISDAALNIRPDLMQKVDIVQNAIDLSQIMGRLNPKVAILSAVETVNPEIPSTLDAAALCKMADRGQIQGGRLDGPLAFDNAISPHAADIKKIKSTVAGEAEILIVPDLESGNMLSKQLEYLAGAIGCGVVLGCKVPIALTSRADGPTVRMASALLAKLIAHHYRVHRP